MLLVKDQLSANLPDIQQTKDERGVALAHAGVRKVEFPLKFKTSSEICQTSAECNLSVGLLPEVKGANMSRFIAFLNDLSEEPIEQFELLGWLRDLVGRLDGQSASLEIAFKHFAERIAPITEVSAPMAYSVSVFGELQNRKASNCRQVVSIEVPVGNLCPCSKAISEHGAHAQRAVISVTADVNPELKVSLHWIERLIETVEEQGSCAVFPHLKRADEKWVTERQYENPKFVEDIARDVTLALDNFEGLIGFSIDVEAMESIHAHNAWAGVRKRAG